MGHDPFLFTPHSQVAGISALFDATSGSHVEVINALVAFGADINVKTNVGGGLWALKAH